MSGPKTSVLSANFKAYEALSESQRTTWAENEILASFRAMAVCEKKISLLIQKIEALQDSEHPDERVTAILNTAREMMTVTFDDIDPEKEFTQKELSSIKSGGAEDVYRWQILDSVDLEGKYLEYFQSIRGKTFDQKVNIARGCAAKAAKMRTHVRKLEPAFRDLEEAAKEAIFQEGIRTSFYIPFKSVRNRANAEEVVKKINDALSVVADMIITDAMLERFRVLKSKAVEIKDASYLANFYQLVVLPFVEECTAYDAFYNARFAEYEEYKTSYEILCNELSLVPQVMEVSAEGIEFYKSKTEELQEILLKRRTREMVMKTVDEVMEEMGYDLLATRDVVKKSGKQYHDELFVYNEGTAISVVQSSEGQITMEIGGLDYGDRMPTDREAQDMSATMLSFCMDYDKITEALKRHGFDMKQVSRLPADPQYAMIINLDDYNVTGTAQTITEVKKTQEQTVTRKKELHAEN